MNQIGRTHSFRSRQEQSESRRSPSGGYVGYIQHMSSCTPRPKTCQWIEGEPRQRGFCGEPVQEDSSYCETHHARCYRKVLTDGE